eukprot:TRINITY_DN2722_c0_g1_i1.p1 TRINITY_DN2722_c0_g1~~TRINITY_DN2722_c0_g1_i1.p1  ORF type:complete len:107 (-),score=19.62 TRINITY_DN2722_c0_g1_i1:2-322(-)
MITDGFVDEGGNDEKLFKCITDVRKKQQPVDLILVIRTFTHPQMQSYITFKRFVSKLAQRWPYAPVILIYTRSCNKPDMDIIRNLKKEKSTELRGRSSETAKAHRG